MGRWVNGGNHHGLSMEYPLHKSIAVCYVLDTVVGLSDDTALFLALSSITIQPSIWNSPDVLMIVRRRGKG